MNYPKIARLNFLSFRVPGPPPRLTLQQVRNHTDTRNKTPCIYKTGRRCRNSNAIRKKSRVAGKARNTNRSCITNPQSNTPVNYEAPLSISLNRPVRYLRKYRTSPVAGQYRRAAAHAIYPDPANLGFYPVRQYAGRLLYRHRAGRRTPL